MAMTNPLQFIQQVRAEVAKVVWPSRRETTITTGMVFVMATIFALFFFSVDLIVRSILGLFLLLDWAGLVVVNTGFHLDEQWMLFKSRS
jgi:preprotein translocase subunit SecE